MPSANTRSETETGTLNPDQKRQLVQRVLKSQLFSRSQTMRSFLFYITEHAISGSSAILKEQAIGVEALGRKPDYDPTNDNIVRVRAHELRARLAKYFETEGIEEPFVITVPKGSYSPHFAARTVVSTDLPDQPAELPVEGPQTVNFPVRNVLKTVTIALVSSLITLAFAYLGFRSESRVDAAPPRGAIQDFWGQFFDKPDKELRIVYADTDFGLWQDLHGKTLDLGDYLSQKYLHDPSDSLREVAMRRSTSPADVSVTAHLAALTAGFGGRVTPQFARGANAEFVRHGDIVLIGSRRSNPWVELYEPYLNFRLEQSPQSGAPRFRNRAPRPSETSIYAIPEMLDAVGDEQTEITSYGLIALLERCGDRGFVVLDEGLNMQATQAVGEMITDGQQLDTLLHSIGHTPGTKVVPFEALIQLTSLPGSYNSPRIAAFRLHPTGSCVSN
jgi:hypothetical protein